MTAPARTAYNAGPMPRALALSLADHVVDWRHERWPIRWDEVFGRTAPLASRTAPSMAPCGGFS